MSFFYIVHIVICVLLILIILFQDGKTGGLVSVADTGNSVFGASGASSFLTKLTSGVAIVFMVTSVFLAFMNSPDDTSIADDYTPKTTQSSGTNATPQDPAGAQPAGDVVVTDEDGNQVTKSFADTEMTMEKFNQDEVPKEILEAERLLKEKEAQKAKEKAEKAKADKDNKEKNGSDKPKEDQ